jgi:hypothetical protein
MLQNTFFCCRNFSELIVFSYLTLLITVDKPMTKCTRVEHPSYHLDELRSIRINMKSNTGYVPTKPGDLPSEALAKHFTPLECGAVCSQSSTIFKTKKVPKVCICPRCSVGAKPGATRAGRGFKSRFGLFSTAHCPLPTAHCSLHTCRPLIAQESSGKSKV